MTPNPPFVIDTPPEHGRDKEVMKYFRALICHNSSLFLLIPSNYTCWALLCGSHFHLFRGIIRDNRIYSPFTV